MSENKVNDLIERYLYDVVRRLPEKQKADIEKELRSLIEDMISEREESEREESKSREECIKEVLNELGNPAKLARSYRGEHDSIISGEYYDSYCFILKIVLICAGAGILISNIVSAIIHVVESEGINYIVWSDVINIGFIPTILIQIFGGITLVFIILERNKVKFSINDSQWTLEKLPEIPYKKAVISRGESAVGIIFCIIFTVVLIFAPHLFDARIMQGESRVSIPLFNLSIWDQVLPFFVISMAVGIMDEFVKLLAGRYTYKVMITNIVTGIISFISAFIILKIFPIWNEQFIPEIQEAAGPMLKQKFDLLTYFNTDFFTNILLFICLFFTLLDMGITIYRTLRYTKKR